MPKRIWVAEGVASDGDMYGRALQLPDGQGGGGTGPDSGGGTGVQRKAGTILKSHLGDIPSCPCLAALVPDAHERTPETADV
jgi:hypothetical protein